MSKSIVKIVTILFMFILLLPLQLFSKVDIVSSGDNNYKITADNYTATVNELGHITSLRVGFIELLDTTTTNSYTGAFVFDDDTFDGVTITQNENVINISSKNYTAKYSFADIGIDISITNKQDEDLSFLTILSPQTEYLEHAHLGVITSTVAEYLWGDVIAYTTLGGVLRLERGTAVWGTNLNQQVWECVVKKKNTTNIKLLPEHKRAINPGLARLTKITISTEKRNSIITNTDCNFIVSVENMSTSKITGNIELSMISTKNRLAASAKTELISNPHTMVEKNIKLLPTDPGFYKVQASIAIEGSVVNDIINVGYQTDKITTTAVAPKNLLAFWAENIVKSEESDTTLNVGIASRTRSTRLVTVRDFMINDSILGRFSGYIAYPKYPGNYPAVIMLPGDRVNTVSANTALAQHGFIVITLEPSGQAVFGRLEQQIIGRLSNGLDSPDTFQMKNGVLRVLKTINELIDFKAPEGDVILDANRIAISGTGIGATIGIIVAVIDERIVAVAADMPYYCDIQRNKENIFPYPEVEEFLNANPDKADAAFETLKYFDLASYASSINFPVLLSIGANDDYSLPENIYAVFNSVKSPKIVDLYDSGHEGGGAYQWEKKIVWLSTILGVQ